MAKLSLSKLPDDIVIHICGLLTVNSVLSFRQTSKRFFAITKLLIVWRNLFHCQVLRFGYPFLAEALKTTNARRLEHLVRRACQIASFWLSSTTARPRLCCNFDTFTKGTGISEIRFLPGHDAQRFVTVSKGIWSVITCWDLRSETSAAGDVLTVNPQVIAEWCPKSVILTGFAVNTDPDARGLLAVSMDHGGVHSIQILALEEKVSSDDLGALSYHMTSIQTIEANCRAMLFQGSVLYISDGIGETHVVDCETTRSAVLQRPPSEEDPDFSHNKCLQVLLTEEHVFVVRARVVELYIRPKLLLTPLDEKAITRPVLQFSFGWVDGVSLTPRLPAMIALNDTRTSHGPKELPPISIVLRSQMDDPWSSDTSKVELYTLHPNPLLSTATRHTSTHDTPDSLADYLSSLHLDGTQDPVDVRQLPYIQPPTLVTSLSYASARGTLRCPAILSGKFGTSIWIQPPRFPRTRRDIGLVAFDLHSSQTQGFEDVHPVPDAVLLPPDIAAEGGTSLETEVLVGALFPGPLRSMHKRNAVHVNVAKEDVQRDSRDDYGLRNICTPFTGSEIMSSKYWTSMDYAEEWGRVILGSSDGIVTFVEL